VLVMLMSESPSVNLEDVLIGNAGVMTVMVAVVAGPVPASVELTPEVMLVCTPGVTPVTFTAKAG